MMNLNEIWRIPVVITPVRFARTEVAVGRHCVASSVVKAQILKASTSEPESNLETEKTGHVRNKSNLYCLGFVWTGGQQRWMMGRKEGKEKRVLGEAKKMEEKKNVKARLMPGVVWRKLKNFS